MSFLEDFEKTLNTECLQNEPAFCEAACPFKLDVKDLVEKCGKRRWNAAFRSFSNTVGFPFIVAAACDAPCERQCLRSLKDSPVQLHKLEQSMLALARRREPNSYNLPSKGKKVAVVGGGISGLGCALLLCNKKYEVTLFEKTERPGGLLRQQMDPELFDRDVETQFRHEKLDIRLNTEIRDPAELKAEYDAVYVAAGENSFGLMPNGEGAFASTLEGVFFGGRMCGRSPMEALADGLKASQAVERYLKTGLMNQPSERKGTRLTRDLARCNELPAVQASGDNGLFTDTEAAEEAGRCARCACDACMRECDLLRLYKKTPRRIYEEIYITVRPGTLVRDGTWATRLLSTCSQCGLCKKVCPQHIDIGEFFLDGHRAMHEKGSMPWAFHDYWLRDMESANTEGALYLPGKELQGKPKYLYFPGCQMGASDPAYVKNSWTWLEEQFPESAMWLHCCGAPAEWAGSEELREPLAREIREKWEELGRPEFIFGCASCRKQFDKYLPEIPGRFLYELMAERSESLRNESAVRKPLSLFDPCASRDYPALQQAVRRLAERAGVPLVSRSREGGDAQCCSYGGQISVAAKNYADELVKERIEDRCEPYLCYCVNCRDIFAGRGKESYHILDLFFGDGTAQGAPNITERRHNRLELKAALCGENRKETMSVKLFVDPEVQQKLSSDLIREEDAAEVIRYCEESGRKLMDPKNGHFIGHLLQGHMTYWAEYAPEEDGYRLFSAYAHRMCLEQEDPKGVFQ